MWDRTKSHGTPRTVLDVSRLRNLGRSPTYDLDAGIRGAHDWFVSAQDVDAEVRSMTSAP